MGIEYENLGDLQVQLTAEFSGLLNGYNKGIQAGKQFETELNSIQSRIMHQFQSLPSGFGQQLEAHLSQIENLKQRILATDPFHATGASSWLPGQQAGSGFSEQIRQQMEAMQQAKAMRASLAEQIWGMGNSPEAAAMRNVARESNALRQAWKHDQEMMTMLTRVEVAKRAAIMNQFRGMQSSTGTMSAAGMQFAMTGDAGGLGKNGGLAGGVSKAGRSFVNLMRGSFMKAGIVGIGVWAGTQIMKGVTEGMAVSRRGGSKGEVFEAVVSSIPIVDQLNEMVKGLMSEWTGANAAAEKYEATVKGLGKSVEMMEGYINRKELLGKTGVEQHKIQVMQEYRAELEKIRVAEQERIKANPKDEEAIARAKSWGKSMREAAAAFRDADLAEPFKTITEELEKQIYLVGESAKAIAQYKALQDGMSYDEIHKIGLMHDELAAKEKGIEQAKQIKDMEDEIANSIAEQQAELNGVSSEEQNWLKMLEKANALEDSAEKEKLIRNIQSMAGLAKTNALREKQKEHQKQVEEDGKALYDMWETAMTPLEQYYKTLQDIDEQLARLEVPEDMKDFVRGRLQGNALDQYVREMSRDRIGATEGRAYKSEAEATLASSSGESRVVYFLERIDNNTKITAQKRGIE